MALVVLLRGVNVGGHRTFRPAALVRQLAHLDAVNIGAAGTFVIRRPIARARLREELARRLPFVTEILICEGRDLLALAARNPFADDAERTSRVRPSHLRRPCDCRRCPRAVVVRRRTQSRR